MPGTYRLHRSRRSPGGTASRGFVQRSPLRRPGDTGVHSRLLPCGRCLRGLPATADPRSALVVFHHLGGFLLRCRARVLQRAPDPGVHPVFRPPARRVASTDRCVLPRDASLPFEAFPPSVAVAASPTCCHVVHRAPCPRTLSLPLPRPASAVARISKSRVGSVGPRGLPPRTGPLQDRRLPADHARCSPGLCPDPPPPTAPRTGRATRVLRGNVKDRFPTHMATLPCPWSGPRKQLSVRTARQIARAHV